MAIAVPTTASDNAVLGPGNSTSRVVTKPANVTDGDILIAAIAHEANRAITPPAGWTLVASGSAGGTIWLTIYWKRASSEPSSWTFSFDAFMWNEIAVFRVTGCLASGDVLDGTPSTNGTTGSTATWNSVTTTAANSAAFCIGGVVNDGTNWGSWSNSFTEAYDNSKTGIAWKVQASAGAVGSTTATIGSGAHAAIMFALKEAGGGGATYTGSATPSLPALTASGTGTLTAPTYTGTAAIALPALTAAGTGAYADQGSAAVTLPALTAAGTGTFTAPVYTGDAAITLPALTADGAGTFSNEYLGAATVTLPAIAASGSGTLTAPTYTGAAAITLPALTADGAGIFASAVYSGTADATLPALTAAGSGTFTAPTYGGTAAVSLPVLAAAGSGTFTAPVYTGSAAVTLPALVASGTGAFSEAGLVPIPNPSASWGGEREAAWAPGDVGAWGSEIRGRWG